MIRLSGPSGIKSRNACRLASVLLCAFGLFSCAKDGPNHNPGVADAWLHRQGGLHVAATFGPDGRLWRATADKKQVTVDYSGDQGKTFSAPVVINPEPQHIKASGENHPGIAVDGSGHVYVIYPAEGDKQPAMLYFSVSADGGQHFSSPEPLSDKAADANAYQGKLLLDAKGRAYAFWHDERDRSDWRQAGNAIYSTIIDPQRNSGLTARKLADTVCECCRIAAAFDSNRQPVVLARFIYSGSIRDHGLIITQSGKPPLLRRVTDDQWAIEACPEHGPAIAISEDNRFHIAWFTQGSVRQGLFHAYSTDRGEHFSAPLPFGNPQGLASHPDILAEGKRVVLAWTEFDGVKTQLKIMQSEDGGRRWSNVRSIAEAADEADYPFLLSNRESIFVSWNSKTEGYRLIPLN